MSWEDIYLSPTELLSAAQEVLRRWPNANLKKNGVGNLSVLVDGEYVGYIDFYGGEEIVGVVP